MEHVFYLAWYFLIYAFLGWALEVVYHAVTKGKVINRGFLNGPLCPIYGFGMSSVITLLGPVADNILILSVCGILLATVIELVGGFVLLKMFHMRWWDYSNEPMNLGGYICVRFSLAWGVCIVFSIKIIHPFIRMCVKALDGPAGVAAVAFLYFILAIDLVVTILTIAHLNKDLAKLYAIGNEIRTVSDNITDVIGNKSISANVAIQQQRVQLALGKAELKDSAAEFRGKADDKLDVIRDKMDELKLKKDEVYNKLTAHSHTGYGRIYNAFPQLKHTLYNEELRNVITKISSTVKRTSPADGENNNQL